MENKFSKNTHPNLFNDPSFGSVYNSANHAFVQPAKEISPARDTRYPAYAAALADGRLVTDYRSQCSKNVKAGNQFHTKLWLIHHSEEIMDESRRRQVEWSGASLGMANTVPPPATIVHSTPFYSEANPTHLYDGIGVERADAKAPELFGTFRHEPTMAEIQNNRKNIATTQFYEGGRNSRRGF
jgi:hypothetical protein